MTHPIHHIWFDFSETLANVHRERMNQVRYEAYAEATGRAIDNELIAQYTALHEQFAHSNSALFVSLGKSPDWWSERIAAVDPTELYTLADPSIPQVLQVLRTTVPISLFSNIGLWQVLPVLGLETSWFTHLLGARDIGMPKPALDGFYKMVELSQLPAGEILYIGDHVAKDILPAKQVGIQAGLLWSESPEADYSFLKFEEILKVLVH